jgi:hypothetical protein
MKQDKYDVQYKKWELWYLLLFASTYTTCFSIITALVTNNVFWFLGNMIVTLVLGVIQGFHPGNPGESSGIF